MTQDQSDMKHGRREDRESGQQDEKNVEGDPAQPDRRGEARASSPPATARDTAYGDEPGYGYGV